MAAPHNRTRDAARDPDCGPPRSFDPIDSRQRQAAGPWKDSLHVAPDDVGQLADDILDELNLGVAGYYTLVSLPLGTNAAEEALEHASSRGAMKPLAGKLADVRAAHLRTKVGDLDRTLVVVESQELLDGQKRGIASALKRLGKRVLCTDRHSWSNGRTTASSPPFAGSGT